MSQQYTNLSYLINFTDNDPVLLKEGIEMYLKRSPELLELLIQNTKDKNWKGIHDNAHNLYSSTQIVGISSLITTIRKVETLARERRGYEEIKVKVERIKEVMKASFVELNNYIDTM